MKTKIIKSKALFVKKNKNNKYQLEYDNLFFDNIKTNEVIIKTKFASINYKDSLIINGNPGLVRKYPWVPGIDLSGEIYLSNNKRFKKGQKVLVLARPLGVKINGSFSEYVKIPIDWVDNLPDKLSLMQSMYFGTSGFTAILACNLIKKNLSLKSKMPILITGASGGVGILSAIILQHLGYKIVVATSNLKRNKINFFNSINIKNQIDTEILQRETSFPLNKIEYAGVIDSLGGIVLSNSLSHIDNNGILVSIGNILDQRFNASLLPLIIRNVDILGLNAESATNTDRKKIYKFMENFIFKKNIQNQLFKKIKFSKMLSKNINIFKQQKLGKTIIEFD